MVYPDTYKVKTDFNEVAKMLASRCMSSMGRELAANLPFMTNAQEINERLQQVHELRRIHEGTEPFPLEYVYDMRECIARLRLEGTYIEAGELHDLRRSTDTICKVVAFLTPQYPALYFLADGVPVFPGMVRDIDRIIDKFGNIRDDASPALADIRANMKRMEGSISRTLNSILRTAREQGVVEKDVSPTMRDGRLVIPVAPAMKRKINGIVHDESATGKTVFIEPAEVVEANNRIRELEAEEKREIIRVLTAFADSIRPQVDDILASYAFLGQMDLINAKATLADEMQAMEPTVEPQPVIDWVKAVHPLLRLAKDEVVPLDITLTTKQRIIIISGPNAGGKSVCLKTVGLLQYMLQCGLPIPVGDRSRTGVFERIMIDIGDEQSIESDLSTYSSHLTNMKAMLRHADGKTLLLIDEFGSGTEPTIGGAMAEAMMRQFTKKKTFGVITTHYQNLKHFAEDTEGVVNGAMLYDRHEMRPLFQLAIGRPGSSFAIEIARKTGIPEEVIRDASEIVGSEYIQSDKYLQDIVRDKRYWEGKRQTIHQREKQLEEQAAKYESELQELARSRKEVLAKAREQAEELLKAANAKIENTIREIKEAQAEREETRKAREGLDTFKQEVLTPAKDDEAIERKMQQIIARRERKEKRKKEQAEKKAKTAASDNGRKGTDILTSQSSNAQLKIGDFVRIKGLSTIGKVETVKGEQVTVIFGDVRTKMSKDKLERTEKMKSDPVAVGPTTSSKANRQIIDERQGNFHQDIDIRGMRVDEALNTLVHFIDDALLVGISRVRILHGTGTGALRQITRNYLATVPAVESYRDEHVQFGGAGITVADLG